MANLLTQPLLQFFNNGVPLNGGLVFFYQSGTTTKTTIYQDNGITQAPNPVTLNSNGVPSNSGTPIPIYFPHGQTVKIVIAPSGAGDPPSSTLYTFDPVIGEQDIDYSTYFTATSSSILTLNSGKTLAVSGTIDLSSGSIKIATIKDTNGNTIITLTPTSSAVNGITITDAATGNDPSIAASGTDTNIGLDLKGQGTGPVKLGQATSTDVRLVADQPIADSSGNPYIAFTKTASAVNRLNITNAAASGTVVLAPSGSDTTIPFSLDTKGASTLNLGNTNATSIQLGNSSSPITANGAINNSKVTIASASTVNIGAAASNVIDISGTTTITAFDTISAGAIRFVRFTGALTLTYNATSLILPGAANITTVNGDCAVFESLGSGNWQCLNYAPINRNPLSWIAQEVHTINSAVATGSTVIPLNDTIPQNTAGDQYMSLSITPKNTSNLLRIDVIFNGTNTTSANFIMALFQDSGSNALATVIGFVPQASASTQLSLTYWMTAGTTSSTTFKIRAGSASAGTTTFNGQGGGRLSGGTMASSITITEYSI